MLLRSEGVFTLLELMSTEHDTYRLTVPPWLKNSVLVRTLHGHGERTITFSGMILWNNQITELLRVRQERDIPIRSGFLEEHANRGRYESHTSAPTGY